MLNNAPTVPLGLVSQARPFTQKARGKGSGQTPRVYIDAMKIVAGMRSNYVIAGYGENCHHHKLTCALRARFCVHDAIITARALIKNC